MKQLVCPHFGTISGLQWWCLNGKFPVDCEHCDCEDKYYIEVFTTANTTDMIKELKKGIPAIVARLDKDFCGGRERLALLFWSEYRDLMHPAGYYEDGEDIPMSVIKDWQEVTI